ncbi:sterile alpha motif domain-containing protein 3-like [Erpetoichthys calabaricus]|uniref:sterile alpha motif domain-containing protein 3-like n=1 Tax=Erpetoichthys calabaricus TaxID=27687 RepID=UPI002234686C|nr:sterile alpha motif domain-containing protein 3-like [Erpetoichthys calabaricus]
MLLRVKLAIDNIRKITLELPGTVKELHSMLKAMFNLQGDFVIQYEDPDFHNELCNLINITDLPKDKATLEIVFKCSDSCFSDSSLDTASGHSLTSDDAFTARLRSLPESFTIPFFSYDVEYRLKQGNEAYKIDGSVLSFSKDMKIDILDWLANAMYEFKAYPDGQQYESVAKALTEKHPCLKEPGSKYGWHQWKFRLKFKMANYRRKLSTAGCPEVSINRLKRRDEHSKLVKKKKKAKRLELNFLPTFPQGKTAAVLEEEWKALVEEMSKKKIDWNLVDKLMLSTFALWRWVIVEDAPLVSDVKSSWPALFTQSQVTAEFTRLLCKNLQASFMEGLDVYVPRLLQMYRENGAGIPELRSLLQCLEKEVQRE